MKYKINLMIYDLEEAEKFFSYVFNGKVIKPYGKLVTHVSLELFDKLSLYISKNMSFDDHSQNTRIVIYFENDELFLETVNRVRMLSNELKITHELKEYIWGTSMFKFTDKFGFNWVFEIETKKL